MTEIKEISGKYFKIVDNLLTNNECKELITLLDNKLETVDNLDNVECYKYLLRTDVVV